jgi:hypothetical protein
MAEMNIYEKLMKVQQTLKAPKNQFNSFGKYHYRSCEDILEGLKPCLKEVKAAVTIDDEIVEIGGRVYVKATAKFHDAESGVCIINTAYAREPETKTGMDLAQLTGATSSYARKYALNGLFMIDDNKDADTDESKIESASRAKKQDKVKTAETEKRYIDERKVNALMKKCETDGVSPMTIFDKCNVSSFADLTEKQFYYITQNWTEVFVHGK